LELQLQADQAKREARVVNGQPVTRVPFLNCSLLSKLMMKWMHSWRGLSDLPKLKSGPRKRGAHV
jgi:hypothetical protein